MRIGLVAVILLMPVLVRAQDPSMPPNESSSINHYVSLFSSVDGSDNISHKDFSEFLEKLESRRSSFRNEHAFLQYVFTKTHQKFLKSFSTYASFSEVFGNGNYNCLSGTAIYALLLEHFKMDYTIIETNYHIFLLVNTANGRVLLEATDPVKGFVEKPADIEKKIQEYRQNLTLETSNNKRYYHYSFDLYNEVRLDQLLGLMYYNLSIVNYNNKEFQAAIDHLDKALELYDTPRIEEFSRVILLSVIDSSLDEPAKEFYVRKIQSLRKKRVMMVATAKAN